MFCSPDTVPKRLGDNKFIYCLVRRAIKRILKQISQQVISRAKSVLVTLLSELRDSRPEELLHALSLALHLFEALVDCHRLLQGETVRAEDLLMHMTHATIALLLMWFMIKKRNLRK